MEIMRGRSRSFLYQPTPRARFKHLWPFLLSGVEALETGLPVRSRHTPARYGLSCAAMYCVVGAMRLGISRIGGSLCSSCLLVSPTGYVLAGSTVDA